jgi:hypothetical protein
VKSPVTVNAREHQIVAQDHGTAWEFERFHAASSIGKRSKAMMQLSRDDVAAALGEVDELLNAKIVATGATAEEFAEAQAWLAYDEPLINEGKALAGGRVGQLVEILHRIEEEEPGPMGHRAETNPRVLLLAGSHRVVR